MKKLHIGAILLSGLVAVPLHASMAQTTNVAYGYASEPRPGYVVFFDKGTAQLSSVADQTIRKAAADADRSAGLVRVVGRADYANAVKNELVRDGVPAPRHRRRSDLRQPASHDRRRRERAGQSTR